MGVVTGEQSIDAHSPAMDVLTLGLARTVRASIQAQEYFLQAQIEEGETVLGLLRQKADEVAMILQEADKQLGGVRGRLDSTGVAFSDYLDPSSARSLAVKTAFFGSMKDDGDSGDDDGGSNETEDNDAEEDKFEDVDVKDGGENSG